MCPDYRKYFSGESVIADPDELDRRIFLLGFSSESSPINFSYAFLNLWMAALD
jgi:hypothetical protein